MSIEIHQNSGFRTWRAKLFEEYEEKDYDAAVMSLSIITDKWDIKLPSAMIAVLMLEEAATIQGRGEIWAVNWSYVTATD